MRLLFPALLLLAPLFACPTAPSDAPSEAPAQPAAPEVPPAVARLRADAAAVAARPEAADPVVEVQHILISFRGIPRGPAATRSREEAEVLAAELWARVLAGEDFAALQKQYSDDPGAGTYAMSQDPKVPADWQRKGMVAAFGDVGWRLKVNEVGVAAHDPQKSPFGWHLIKRLR